MLRLSIIKSASSAPMPHILIRFPRMYFRPTRITLKVNHGAEEDLGFTITESGSRSLFEPMVTPLQLESLRNLFNLLARMKMQ